MKRLIVEFFLDKKKQWHFHFKSGNGRILASSEAYSSRKKAEQGADAILQAGLELQVITEG